MAAINDNCYLGLNILVEQINRCLIQIVFLTLIEVQDQSFFNRESQALPNKNT